MTTFDKWKAIAANLHGELINQVRLAVENNKDFLLELNKKQLSQGKDKKGGSLPLYSDSHARKRKKAGLQTSNKDLNFTSEFYNDFYVLAFQNMYEVGSKDSKTKFLEDSQKILGPSKGLIFGLTDENKTIFFQQCIKPHLQTWFRNIGRA
jgi:hypothetical protein